MAPPVGFHHSPETRARLRASHLGKRFTTEHRAKIGAASKARVVSAETRARISAAKAGRPAGPKSPETCARISAATRGKPHPSMLGEGNPNWRKGLHGEANGRWLGGITPANTKLRNSLASREWAKSVKGRDNWTCQICDRRGGDMHADHIKAWALFPELRFNIDNGRTLCPPCHRKFGARGLRRVA